MKKYIFVASNKNLHHNVELYRDERYCNDDEEAITEAGTILPLSTTPEANIVYIYDENGQYISSVED